MRWQWAYLLTKQTEKRDILGNTIDEYEIGKEIRIRLTQFTIEEIATYGRDINVNSRKMLTPYKGDIDLIKFGNETYKVTKTEDLGRFTFAIVEGV